MIFCFSFMLFPYMKSSQIINFTFRNLEKAVEKNHNHIFNSKLIEICTSFKSHFS